MGSWGSSTADESKPKYLTEVEKRDCYADKTGWTVKAGGNNNPAADRETLVAIGGLAGGTSTTARLAHASISSTRFVTTSFNAGTAAFIAEVNYNEAVTVTGEPTLELTVGSGTATLTYTTTGSSANRLRFTGNVTAAENDVIALGANKLAKGGGVEIKDAGTTVDSEITHGAQTANITVGA
tara:strand:+ start:313 stop:858 length:546 start_codon:yes stop_codon:yes gene_type:complete